LTESLLEVSQILAYVSLALISLLVATFAISVSYLGRETHQSLWRKKRRRAELEKKLKELVDKTADVEGIKREIEDYEKEIRELDEKLSSLSVKEAVVYPSALGLTALVLSVINVFLNPRELYAGVLVFIAVVSIAGGSVFLLRTLYAVDWVASRIPLPRFEVSFKSRLKYEKCNSKEHREITFCVSNIGEVLAENVEIFIFFPPDFKVGKKRPYYFIVKQDAKGDHPSYNAAIYRIDFIRTDVTTRLTSIPLDMPEKTGSYTIPVCIYERKIGSSEHELTIEIVERKQN
jgi:hypothetical protein